MTCQNYLVKQNQIYREFLTAMNTLRAVRVAPPVINPVAGYLVAWLHSDVLMQQLAQCNAQINEIAPVMRFDRRNAHTTITVCQLQDAGSFYPDENILRALRDACFELERGLLQSVCIRYEQWLFNEETVIAAGQPNDAFWQTGEALQRAGRKRGLALRMPWGAHITAARYLAGSEKVGELAALIRQTPALGISWPEAVLVGSFACGPTELILATYAIRRI